jgi:hypothetical protein
MYPHGRPGSARLILRVAVCLIALLGLLGCGLEAYYYIDYIDTSNYIDDTRSNVRLPSSGREGYGSEQYFTHFIIFYRIYLSNIGLPSGRLDTQLGTISSYLHSDYNWLYPFTNITDTSVSSSNLDNNFYNRKYFKLEVEGSRSIDSVLDRDSLGSILEINFFIDEPPFLRIGGIPYKLERASASSTPGLPHPQPDNSRYFRNYPELYDVKNATSEINADIAPHSGAGNIQYSYVSMYIAAVGKSFEMPPRNIYSLPTFLGIFRLPE